MSSCHLKPDDKKAFVGKVGSDLVRTNKCHFEMATIALTRSSATGSIAFDVH